MALDKITEKINQAFDVERLPFRRNLTGEEIQKLQKACSLAFSMDIHPQIIEKIMHYCCYVERYMEGRIAGNIEDLIIRYLLRYFASLKEQDGDPNQCHVEIGVLFGAGTIFSYHAVQLAEKDIVTVVIDPFEGYYEQDVDIVTKLRVNEKTFRSNLDHFGVAQNKIRVLKGLSTDEKIIDTCKELKILSLIIDGDHTYEGVKKDWINYSPLVVPGGYVLFDDYNSHAWLEISEFVNKEILSNLGGKWEVVLVYGSSLILKRTDVKDDEASRQTQMSSYKLKSAQRIIEKQKKEIEHLKQIEAKLIEYNRTPLFPLFKKYEAYKRLKSL